MKNVTELNVGSRSVANGAKSKTRNIFFVIFRIETKKVLLCHCVPTCPCFLIAILTGGWVLFVEIQL